MQNVKPTIARENPSKDGRSLSAVLKTALILVGIVAVVFGRVCLHGWIDWDDDVHIARNPGLNPVSLTSVAGFWTRPYELLYIPVSYSFFAAEVAVSRALFPHEAGTAPDPRPFHVMSVVLHAACVVLVWRLIARRVHAFWPAIAGAVLFAVHPLQVESVAWVSEQRGLLATLLALAAMNLQRWSDEPTTGWGRIGSAFAAPACFALAMLAKPQAIVTPLLLLVLDSGSGERTVIRSARRLWPWFLLAAVIGVLAKRLQPSDWSWTGAAVSPLLRPIVAGDAIAFYAEKLLLPRGLCIDHGRSPAVVLGSPWLCVRAIVALALAGSPWFVRGLRPFRMPVALALAALLPVLGLVPFTFQGFSTVADRYAYLPMLGPAMGLALLVDHCRRARVWPSLPWAIALGLTILAVLSFRQASTWRDRSTVNAHAIRTNPDSYGARLNLAITLVEQDRLAEAADILRRAVEAKPDFVKARYELGSTLHKLGDLDGAEQQYEAAIRLRPQWSYVHNDLGILLAQQGRLEEAVLCFRRAVTLRPDLEPQQQNLRRVEELLAAPPSGPGRPGQPVPVDKAAP